MSTKKKRLAVIFGGASNEHEISIKSATEMIRHLDPAKYDVKPVHITPQGRWDIPDSLIVPRSDFNVETWIAESDLDALSHNVLDVGTGIDTVLLAVHGRYGEDGSLQGLLETIGLPYTGSGVLSTALAFDKIAAKQFYQLHGLTTPKFGSLSRAKWAAGPNAALRELEKEYGLPVVVKAPGSGSSRDMGICQNTEELRCLIGDLMGLYDLLMVEEFIAGDEFTCAVLEEDGKAVPLPPTQIIPKKSDFFDYTCKYEPGATDEITPPQVNADLIAAIQAMSLRAHQVLRCRGYSRTDFMYRNNELLVLETNTLPGMTVTSLVPQAAAAAGISFAQLLDRIVQCAATDAGAAA